MISAITTQVAFLPWLRLKSALSVAGVEFLPLRGTDGKMSDVLADLAGPMTAVLAGYVDLNSKPIDNCLVATIPGRGWNLQDSDFTTVKWAASLLFLASWASNEYFTSTPGPYINSTPFRVVWQRLPRVPKYVSLRYRRRDGDAWNGGNKHGTIKFNLPLQYSITSAVTLDENFLKALNVGHSAESRTMQRLRYALPFVGLANTDDDLMTDDAEIILMASAFEQLLDGDASAYKLGCEFSELWRPFGTITVADAQRVRPQIKVMPEHAAAQSQWLVHRKWIEELYGIRSKAVHKGTSSLRPWGWVVYEHMVMAAWVFPLTVKLLLQRDGYYTLTDSDKARCLSVDRLLAATDWNAEPEDDTEASRWQEIVSATTRDLKLDQTAERFFKDNPKFFDADEDKSVSQ